MRIRKGKNVKKIVLIFISILHIYQIPLHADEHLWAGANQYQLWFQREGRIYQQLDAMQETGLKVLRIWLGHRAENQSWEDPPDAYTFENPIGTFHDVNFEKVDFLMSECLNRGIKLIITLNNDFDNYYETFGAVNMYKSTAALTAYKNRFSYALDHYNAYLKKKWQDCDEVVYAWEIQNEPGIPLLNVDGLSTTERHDLIRNFLSEMASHLKSIDPDTKVSLGIAGYANYYHNGKSGDDIRTLGNIEAADIYSLHFYRGNLNRWIDDNLGYCRSINKLLFIEEFGDERKIGMQGLIDLYKEVAQICRDKGVPWMFWRLGHRKDEGTYSINSDDEVWQKVVAPEAELINQTTTPDPWGIDPVSSSIKIDVNNNTESVPFTCYPNPFNNAINIEFRTDRKIIEIKICNIKGKEVFRDSLRSPNSFFRFNWNGTDQVGNRVSSGIYILTILGDEKLLSRKICLMK